MPDISISAYQPHPRKLTLSAGDQALAQAPDTLPTDDLLAQIKAHFPGATITPETPVNVGAGSWTRVNGEPPPGPVGGEPFAAEESPEVMAQDEPIDNSPAKYFSTLWNDVNPIKFLGELFNAGPPGIAKAIIDGFKAQSRQAKSKYNKGRPVEALGHALAAIIPMLGPMAAQSGEDIAAGRLAEGLAHATAILGPSAGKYGYEAARSGSILPTAAAVQSAPGLMAQAGIRTPMQVLKDIAARPNPNPVSASAAQFALDRGIPIDAATATGSKAVRGIQTVADESLPGMMVREGADKKFVDSMRRVGGELASDTNRTGQNRPMTPQEAGDVAAARARSTVRAAHTQTNAGYDDWRKIVRDPANRRDVQVSTERVDTGLVGADGKPIVHTRPVTASIASPVDMRDIKADLQPIWKAMQERRNNTQIPLPKQANTIARVLDGADHLSLEDAEYALGEIKALVRQTHSDGSLLRSRGEGTLLGVTAKLDKLIKETAAALPTEAQGTDAVGALSSARATSALEHRFDKFFREMTGKSDALEIPRGGEAIYRKAISSPSFMAALEKRMPGISREFGRAWIDQTLGKGTARGAWGRTDGMLADWHRLGEAQKKLMFPSAAHRQALGDFFNLGTNWSELYNPSGTWKTTALAGQIGAIYLMQPTALMMIPLYKLSKLMHDADFVRSLVHAAKVVKVAQKTQTQLARGVAYRAIAHILDLAGAAAQHVPMAAQSQPGKPDTTVRH